jgi:hypothetical protein
MHCVYDCLCTVYAHIAGYRRSKEVEASLRQEVMVDQINTRLVTLELQDKRCLNDARRFKASGTRGLFRSRMLEHRRLQAQMLQLQRFRENVMAQFDALSNHELNRSFVRTMQELVGNNKDRVAETREDAESVMEEFNESISQVKDLSEFLGQASAAGGDEVTDEELDAEFGEQMMLSAGHHDERGGASPALAPHDTGLRTTETPTPPLPASPMMDHRQLVLPAALHAH